MPGKPAPEPTSTAEDAAGKPQVSGLAQVVGYAGQVHPGVGLDQQRVVALELCRLRLGHGDAHGRRALEQDLLQHVIRPRFVVVMVSLYTIIAGCAKNPAI